MPTIQENVKEQTKILKKLGLILIPNEEFDREEIVVEICDEGKFRVFKHPDVDGFSVRNDFFQNLFELWYTTIDCQDILVADLKLKSHPIRAEHIGKEIVERTAGRILQGWINEIEVVKIYSSMEDA